MSKTYTAHVKRDGRWWMISVPELDGLTQARRLAEVETMAREFIAIETGAALDDVTVHVVVDEAGEVKNVGARAAAVLALRERAQDLELRAVAEMKALAGELNREGITVRDIGEILGVSFQRAQQLTSAQ